MSLAARSLLLFVALALPAASDAADVHVATTGSDAAGDGSQQAPFRTIQRGAQAAQAGDSVVIHAGVYREKVAPPRSGTADAPITFRAATSGGRREIVVVSGAEPVTGWSLASGKVYRAAMPDQVESHEPHDAPPFGRNQVFVDGQMMVHARWPNISPERVTAPRGTVDLAVADGGSGSRRDGVTTADEGWFDSAALAVRFGDHELQGARITFLSGFMVTPSTALVDNVGPRLSVRHALDNPSEPASKSWFADPGEWPHRGSTFYVWGKANLLDAPGEWFRDPDTATLSLWMPAGDDPADHLVEVKRRYCAFDLRGRSYITLDGLVLFAATAVTDPTSHHLTMRRLDVRYVGHSDDAREMFYTRPHSRSIELNGTDCVIEDSTLTHGAFAAVQLNGRRNVVRNSVVSRVNYIGSGYGIDSWSGPDGYLTNDGGADANRFEDNTIFDGGHTLVKMARALHIRRNDVYRSHLQGSDLGAISICCFDGAWADVAYNWVHDLSARTDATVLLNGAQGIFFDSGARSYHVHHNVTWNVSNSGVFAYRYEHDAGSPPPVPYARVISHNTVIGNLQVTPSRDPGTYVLNNLALKGGFGSAQEVHAGNLFIDRADGQLVDPAAQDFRLLPTSAGIDAGVSFDPVTGSFTGPAPDVGAYELGARWIAGALLTQEQLADVAVAVGLDASGEPTATVTGVPVGRKVPLDLQISVGGGAFGGTVANRTDYATSLTTATVTKIPRGGEVGGPVRVRIGGGPVVEKGRAALGFSVTGVSVAGGTVIVHGTGFLPPIAARSSRTIRISNPSGVPLGEYAVLLVVDTASLVAAGKLRADGNDLRFTDGVGNREYWIQGGMNTPATRIWVKVAQVPVGGTSVTMSHGDGALPPISNPARVFHYWDGFDGRAIPDRYDVVSAGEPGVVATTLENGGIRIRGDATRSASYSASGLSFNARMPPLLPASGRYIIESDVALQHAGTGYGVAAGSDQSTAVLLAFPGRSLEIGRLGSTGQWTALAGSTLPASGWAGTIGVATNPATPLGWFENGRLAAVGPQGAKASGLWALLLEPGSTAELSVDNLRVRDFVYPEPVASLGAESITPGRPAPRVAAGDLLLQGVVWISPNELRASYPGGPVPASAEIRVENGDGAVAVAVVPVAVVPAALAVGGGQK